MKTLGKCQILSLVTMTPIMLTMTQKLTSMKNGSNEETNGTKYVQQLKKKKKEILETS